MKKNYILTIAFILFSFVSFSQVSILLVNDNGYAPERVDVLKTALEDLSYAYTFYDTPTAGVSPSADYMAPFDLVIWYTGNDGGGLSLWNGDDTDNTEIKSYIDGGGMMWLQGLDFLYDRYGSAPDTFAIGDFSYDYLGISQYHAQSHYDNAGEGEYDGVPYFSVVPDNGIFTLDTLKWQYSTLWGADALTITDEASPLYIMGPPDYGYAGFVPCLYLEKGDGKVMTMSTETARFDSQERLDTLFAQGLAFFDQFASGEQIDVESIAISSEGDATTIDTKGGALQFYATVLPEDATNPNVHWSLMNNQAHATIDQSGVLHAFSSSYGNGTTTVVAESIDGSGISATMDVTISGQGEAGDFEVLLVNDNANGATRYQELDTTLMNLGYSHAVYNTAITDDYPNADLLKSFDVVMWYTGNDGLDLKLWDKSDTLDYKFNEAIIDYADNGGIFWLSGLDFFYDVFGSAPYPAGDDLFTEGQFIYDYMGIQKYVAQSRADDGGSGVAQMDVVLDNSLCELTPVQFAWSTLWFADALIITDDAEGIYKMGPSDYVFAPFFTGVYKEHNASKMLTFTFELAKMDSRENNEELVDEVLSSLSALIGVDDIESIVSSKIFPNPLTNTSTLVYDLKDKANIDFFITDIMGKQVYFVNQGTQSIGQHELTLSINELGLASGTYFYTIAADGQFSTKKMLVIK